MPKKIAWILESGEENRIDTYASMLEDHYIHFIQQPFNLNIDLDQPGEYDLFIISAEYEDDFSEFLGFVDQFNQYQISMGSDVPVLVPLYVLDLGLHGLKVVERGATVIYKPFDDKLINRGVKTAMNK